MNTIIILFFSVLCCTQPKSTVGTPAYIAPGVLARKEYDGKVIPVLLVLCHAMVYLAKKLDMFRSEAASFLCCYLICADSTVLLQGLESDDVDKKPATGKAEDEKMQSSRLWFSRLER